MDEQSERVSSAFDSDSSGSENKLSSQAPEAPVVDEDEDEQNNGFNDLDQIKGGFKLDLGASNLNELGIEFVIKFSRVFKTINEVNFGKQKMKASAVEKFGEQLKLNKYIEKVDFSDQGFSGKQANMLKAEIAKNI